MLVATFLGALEASLRSGRVGPTTGSRLLSLAPCETGPVLEEVELVHTPLEVRDSCTGFPLDRALVELTDTAGLNGAARKKAAKKKKQKEARKAELEAALQEARDEGNGGNSDDPRVAQMKWLQESGGA